MATNDELPKGMSPPIVIEKSLISLKELDYGGILLRKIGEIKDLEFDVIDLQINEGAGKSPTISLVLRVHSK